jgi:hypothetical protein
MRPLSLRSSFADGGQEIGAVDLYRWYIPPAMARRKRRGGGEERGADQPIGAPRTSVSRDGHRPKATAGRVGALLQAGDHRAARAEARARLADAAASEAERAEAAAALASLAPDRGAVIAGVVGIALAIVVAAWTVLAG